MQGILFKPDMIKGSNGQYIKVPSVERFLQHIKVISLGCWEWQGSVDVNGYGHFWDGEIMTSSHKYSYQYFNGIIPTDLEIDHLCRNRKCVNPDHLEVVTHRENVLRGLSPSQLKINGGLYQKVKTHCPKGHPYDETNTYYTPSGSRDCRICQRRRVIEYRQRSKS